MTISNLFKRWSLREVGVPLSVTFLFSRTSFKRQPESKRIRRTRTFGGFLTCFCNFYFLFNNNNKANVIVCALLIYPMKVSKRRQLLDKQ